MAPSLTETIYALGLGDRLVGATRYCLYPPEARAIPKVGGFLDPNFEAIIALKPDLVILLTEHERTLPGFQKLGLETHVVCHKNMAGIIDSLRSIAASAAWTTEAGTWLIISNRAWIESVKKPSGPNGPK